MELYLNIQLMTMEISYSFHACITRMKDEWVMVMMMMDALDGKEINKFIWTIINGSGSSQTGKWDPPLGFLFLPAKKPSLGVYR